MGQSSRSRKVRSDWTRASATELLSWRLCDLGLHTEGDWLARASAALQDELEKREIQLRPHMWLSEEWFCPDGVAGFAVPFYLAHPRLRRLERQQMFEVEGGTHRRLMRLLRHETGHAVDNAYRLRKKVKRKKIFGDPRVRYPDYYVPKPFSRRFVRHLEQGYAQSHPDEDFAETFAVWLDPASKWRERYAGWPALQKLQTMDGLMREVAGYKPPVTSRRRVEDLSRLRTTLGAYYANKRERFQVDAVDELDEVLERLFGSGSAKGAGRETAARFLSSNRGAFRAHVAAWTGVRRYTVDSMLGLWIARARSMRLSVRSGERETERNALTALTRAVVQYEMRGLYRLPL